MQSDNGSEILYVFDNNYYDGSCSPQERSVFEANRKACREDDCGCGMTYLRSEEIAYIHTYLNGKREVVCVGGHTMRID